MDLLNIAGIGPDNWSERRKTWSFIALAIQKEDCTSIYLGRHTPEEYAEFYECLDRAANEHKALEAHLSELMQSVNNTQTSAAQSEPTRLSAFDAVPARADSLTPSRARLGSSTSRSATPCKS